MPDLHHDLILALGTFVAGDDTAQEVLDGVLGLAVREVSGATMAGVSMAGVNGKPDSHVITDERAYDADRSQYDADNGPCLDAWREDRTVWLKDVREARATYPQFAEAAVASGILSTLSLPLRLGGSAIGAINLYAEEVDGFSDADRELAGEVAVVIGIVMATATRYAEASDLAEGLNRAMSSRAAIEQAKGIIMASSICSPEEAFDLLRQQSQAQNRKLREIAAEIVARQGQVAPDLAEGR